jgi:hypothetical protein
MRNVMAKAAVLLCVFSLLVSCGPSNFDECILKNMKGVNSDLGARSIGAACLSQFPAT